MRALQSSDAVAAHALLDIHAGGTRHHARLREQLDLALSGRDAEYAGLVSIDVAGVLLFGPVAGAPGVVKLHAGFGDSIAGLLDAFLATPARLIVCELASDAALGVLLRSRGFESAGQVADWFARGIALDILVLRQG